MFESPNRTLNTLELFGSIAETANLLLARELTKIYEEILEGSPAEIISLIQNGALKGKLKGEVTLIFSKTKNFSLNNNCDEVKRRILQDIDMLQQSDMSTKELAKIISKKHFISKNMVYKILLSVKC